MIDKKETVIPSEGDLKDDLNLDNTGQSGEGDGVSDKEKKGYEIDPLLEGDEEEEVTVKRGALKKVRSDLENYKTVAIAAKKGPKNPSKPESDVSEDKFITRAEVEKDNEKKAIEELTVVSDTDDEMSTSLKKEINDNWDAIKPFYTGKSGKKTPQAIKEDILDAHAAWKRRHGGSNKDTTGKEVVAQLSTMTGMGGFASKKPVTGERKRILPSAQSPKNWYGGSKE